jgi:hypothetical protein
VSSYECELEWPSAAELGAQQRDAKFVSLPAKALAPCLEADPGGWDRHMTTEQLVEFGGDHLVILAAVRGNRSSARSRTLSGRVGRLRLARRDGEPRTQACRKISTGSAEGGRDVI